MKYGLVQNKHSQSWQSDDNSKNNIVGTCEMQTDAAEHRAIK